MTDRPAKEKPAKAKGQRAAAKAPDAAPKPGKREPRKRRSARRSSPLAQALSRLELLRPPSSAELLTVVALVFIALVVGSTWWLYYGTPAPW